MKIKNKKKTLRQLFLAIFIVSLFFGTFLFAENSKADSNCACSNRSVWNPLQLFQYPVIATYSVDNDFACEQKCVATSGSTYYSYSNLANTGFVAVKTCKETGCKDDALPICNKSTGICVGEDVAAKTSTAEMAGSDATPTTAISPTPKKFNYILLESFPGFFTAGTPMTDLPGMILAIYKFGIWTVGIAGLFMLVVGGFMYMTSAGNTSTASSARGIIWDALLGIVAALGAYLILYVINPNLTKISLDFTPVTITEKPTDFSSGNCQPITDTTNPCSAFKLRTYAVNQGDSSIDVDKWSQEASSICNAESGGHVEAFSKAGLCAGKPIAWGLFQVNINSHPIGLLPCTNAFSTIWKKSTASSCTISDPKLYDQCKAKAIDITTNLDMMWTLYKVKYSWNDWEVNLKNGPCHFANGSAKK